MASPEPSPTVSRAPPLSVDGALSDALMPTITHDKASSAAVASTSKGRAAKRSAKAKLTIKWSASSNDAATLIPDPPSRAALLARTVHLRCLPPTLTKRRLGELLHRCGACWRVRICASADVASVDAHKWLYGFVEYDTPAAAQRLIALRGTELSGGPGQPLLRLKCSLAKQPIVDIAPDDADGASGRPCMFGLNETADRPLLDVVHVASRPSEAAGRAAGASVACSQKTAGKGSRMAANGVEEDSGERCGCGCAEDPNARCCSCCKCHEIRNAPRLPLCCGGGASAYTAPIAPSTNASGRKAVPVPSIGLSALAAPALNTKADAVATKDSGLYPPLNGFAALSSHVSWEASSFLDGSQAVAAGRTLLRQGLHNAKVSVSGSTAAAAARSRSEATFQTLLSALDKAAPLTGGPAGCRPGDPDATVPQRATLLRLQACLALGLLQLLRRSLAGALPHFDRAVALAASIPDSPVVEPADVAPGAWPSVELYDPLRGAPAAVRHAVMDSLPTLEEDDDLREVSECKDTAIRRMHGSIKSGWDADQVGFPGRPEPEEPLWSSDAAPFRRDMDDGKTSLGIRDVRFHSAVLNTLLCVGLALEEVQPLVARGVYAMAAERGERVLSMRSTALTALLIKHSSGGAGHDCRLSDSIPVLRTALSVAQGVDNPPGSQPGHCPARDVTDFAKTFFTAVHESEHEESDEDSWWGSQGMPPMHLVRLFPC